MNGEIVRIADQLRRAVEGEAWHGPSVMEIIAGVDARTAAAHPIAGAHSIWEILNHTTAWSRAVLRRLGGQAVELNGDADWPPVKDTSEAAWQAAIASFRAAQSELLARLKSLTQEQLGRTVAGRNYSCLFMLDGLVQHHLYHAGQMALLKKSSVAGPQLSGP